jgi:hypothetical protein
VKIEDTNKMIRDAVAREREAEVRKAHYRAYAKAIRDKAKSAQHPARRNDDRVRWSHESKPQPDNI